MVERDKDILCTGSPGLDGWDWNIGSRLVHHNTQDLQSREKWAPKVVCSLMIQWISYEVYLYKSKSLQSKSIHDAGDSLAAVLRLNPE
jgi:hypothetical protein